MRVSIRKAFSIIALVMLLLGGACTASDLPSPKIKIGDKMADFTLRDPGGKTHSLRDFTGKKAVVVTFIATRCPYSNAFNHVMADLAKEYASRDVAFVGINAYKTEPATDVADHARTNKLGFTVLKDDGNLIANRLGARVTTEVYLLDSDGMLRYHGALGNSHQPTTNPAQATDDEVRPALEAVLAGRAVARAETKAFGCTIKRI
jgi:peroxiredoxin